MGGDNENDIKVIKIFDSVTLNNASLATGLFPQNSSGRGFRSISYKFDTASHADARVTLEYYVSPTKLASNFSRSSDGYLIFSDVHKASGTDSNGVNTVEFEPILSQYIYFVLTETATQDAILTIWETKQ